MQFCKEYILEWHKILFPGNRHNNLYVRFYILNEKYWKWYNKYFEINDALFIGIQSEKKQDIGEKDNC